MTTSQPRDEYLSRIQAIAHQDLSLGRYDRLFVTAKLVTGLLLLVMAVWLAKLHSAQMALIFLPIALLAALFVSHERVLSKLRRNKRLKAFYGQGLARLEDRWMGTGQTGDRFLNEAHPYARDLDIFGRGGLFELLSTARTGAGEETLAAWLLTAASPEEILQRQAAIQELTPQLHFRERLALAGEKVRSGASPESLIAWSEQKQSGGRPLRSSLMLLASLWATSIVTSFLLGWHTVAFCVSLLNLAITYKLRPRVAKAMEGIENASHDLDLIAIVLAEVERMTFHAPKLVELQKQLFHEQVAPSRAVHRLQKQVAWLASNENWFVKLLDLFTFWTPQWVFAAESWRTVHGKYIRRWIAIAGEVEALAALASYTYEHPGHRFPELVEHGPHLHAEKLSHPLLPQDRAIANDLALDENLQLIVISGPNMAGKSTFIRSIGINVVLALAGAPVCAQRLVLSPMQVAASICVLDSLQGGLSRFYAEITRLKTINDLSKQTTSVLFLLDELLSGTNSHDRRVGTESFLKSLLSRGAIGLITTHDLALAQIAENIGERAANYHFADTIENGQLRFDYKLTPGVVQTANALQLMRSIGLDV